MKLYFDESGNSGKNLLDNNQPVFVIAYHNFTNTEAREILSPIKSAADELETNFLTTKSAVTRNVSISQRFWNCRPIKRRPFFILNSFHF